MPQAFRYPSSTNIHPISTQFVIGYIRKKEQFPVNRYVQLVPAPAPTFFYHKFETDQQARIRNINDHVWQPGAKRPERSDNSFSFKEEQAFTVRYNFNETMDLRTLNLHTKQWGAKQVILKGLAQQAMTARTSKVISALQTVGNWPTGHVVDANTLNDGAGRWDTAHDDPSNAGYNAIKKALGAAVSRIFLDTNSRVQWGDLRLIISPEAARKMANSPEIHNYAKYNTAGATKITGDKENYNSRWGLPRWLYDVEIVVEDTPYVYDLPTAAATGGTTSRAYLKADSSAILMTRPGEIDAESGPSFSTCQVWWYESQMVVKEFTEPKDELVSMNVEDEYSVVLPAAEAGMLITNIIS